MNKKISELQTAGYQTPECKITELVATGILCASTKDGQINDLTVEQEDPFNWV